MKLSTILSRELPGLNDLIKGCINEGHCLLFKPQAVIVTKYSEEGFYLKVDKHIYALGSDGQILREVDHFGGGVKIDKLYYFLDLPRPECLSKILV